MGSGSSQTAVYRWMNGTPHRHNLLSPNYTQFGVGYVYDADCDYGGCFVAVFAGPGPGEAAIPRDSSLGSCRTCLSTGRGNVSRSDG